MRLFPIYEGLCYELFLLNGRQHLSNPCYVAYLFGMEEHLTYLDLSRPGVYEFDKAKRLGVKQVKIWRGEKNVGE